MSTTQHGTQVRLPKLGESVQEGTIGAWLKKIGDRVEKYEPLVEITTDKVNAEVPAPVAGVLISISADEGETLPVGAEICQIDETGGAVRGASTAAPSIAESTSTPAAPESNAHPRQPAAPPRPTSKDGELDLLRARSSPAVRRIAEEHGLDISQVEGTGIGGRVTKRDILEHVAQLGATERPSTTAPRPAEVAQPTPAQEMRAVGAADAAIQETVAPPRPAERAAVAEARPAEPPSHPGVAAPSEPAPAGRVELWEGDTVVPLSPMRRQIAEHMVRSERTAPHVTTWMEVDMSGVVAARSRAQERFTRDEGFELTYLPFVIKATVHALRQHPEINAVWDGDRIIRRRAVNIGVAVSLDDGLIVPVIKDADEKSLAGIARAVRDLATRARSNRLTIDDVQGGTFTVNNPGTFGTVISTPIIVQPQAAILSTEAVIKRPVVVNDTIAIRPIMNLSLSIDHRVLDGMQAARFLGAIKRWLEAVTPDITIY